MTGDASKDLDSQAQKELAITPRTLTHACRFALAAIGAALAVLMLGPFSGLEKAFGLRDTQAHFIAFYALAALAFASFPKLRRNDMAMVIVLVGALLEALQAMVGRDAQIGDWLCDLCGVMAVVAPTWVEQMRGLARSHPWMPIGRAWRLNDRRARNKTLPELVRASVQGL